MVAHGEGLGDGISEYFLTFDGLIYMALAIARNDGSSGFVSIALIIASIVAAGRPCFVNFFLTTPGVSCFLEFLPDADEDPFTAQPLLGPDVHPLGTS